VVGTVADIASKVDGSGIVAPTITIIGEVVKLREKLRWFD
jgi:uroporphyrin-III C-methyltransferase/precorrin-2 dehydrogenase/sirohydrochlorin ferrochelatase